MATRSFQDNAKFYSRKTKQMTSERMSKLEYFETDGAIFMGANRTKDKCEIGIYGVPYDGTTSFRSGSRFGPSSIREISHGIETYCPEFDLDLSDLNYSDLGSLKIPYGAPEPVIKSVENATKELLKNNIKPLMLGGEHSITTGAVKAVSNFYPDLILIQLDAHADLRNEWLGSKYNHACTMRRCLEIIPSSRLLQIGIRSGTREEFFELRSEERLITFDSQSNANLLDKAISRFSGKPIYLTIDLDWFDPSVLPGTGTPEPGGFFWNDFAKIIKIISKYNLVAADIVELSPQLDSSGISSILAAKVTRSMLMLLHK